MQAKPGRPKKQLAIARVDYQPPAPPFELTEWQRREWEDITAAPLLTRVDESLLMEYANLMILRDKALRDLHEKGMHEPGAKGDRKTNIHWKIYRDCAAGIMEIKKMLMATPRARAELNAAGLLAPAGEDDIETD